MADPPPRFLFNKTKFVFVAIAVAVVALLEINPFGMREPANRALGLLFVMALWWITETFPLHWVSLLPFVYVLVLPVVGPWTHAGTMLGANLKLVAEPYVHPLIFLFLGGMLIGVAMEEHNLHKRIALNIIRVIGSNPRRVLLGFILATAFISMWISNTATAVMMVPIGMALISQMESREGGRLPLLGQSIMLSIAYGANVGGIGTMIGTAPNMIFAGFANAQYKTQIAFLDYMIVGLPFVILFLPIVFLMLAWLCRRETVSNFTPEIVRHELAKLGPMSRQERIVLAVFVATSLLWITNQPFRTVIGLPSLKPDVLDASYALFAGIVLFLTSSLRLRSLRRMSWDALLLLGGSFALAEVVQKSGLSTWLALQMQGITLLHPLVLMLVVTTATILLSAFSSNTATTNVMMLLVSDTLDPRRADPGRVLPYLSGVTISASCDFMLPAGTPPNAIVFGTRYVNIRTMAAMGFFLDLAAAMMAALWVYFGASRLMAG